MMRLAQVLLGTSPISVVRAFISEVMMLTYPCPSMRSMYTKFPPLSRMVIVCTPRPLPLAITASSQLSAMRSDVARLIVVKSCVFSAAFSLSTNCLGTF